MHTEFWTLNILNSYQQFAFSKKVIPRWFDINTQNTLIQPQPQPRPRPLSEMSEAGRGWARMNEDERGWARNERGRLFSHSLVHFTLISLTASQILAHSHSSSPILAQSRSGSLSPRSFFTYNPANPSPFSHILMHTRPASLTSRPASLVLAQPRSFIAHFSHILANPCQFMIILAQSRSASLSLAQPRSLLVHFPHILVNRYTFSHILSHFRSASPTPRSPLAQPHFASLIYRSFLVHPRSASFMSRSASFILAYPRSTSPRLANSH